MLVRESVKDIQRRLKKFDTNHARAVAKYDLVVVKRNQVIQEQNLAAATNQQWFNNRKLLLSCWIEIIDSKPKCLVCNNNRRLGWVTCIIEPMPILITRDFQISLPFVEFIIKQLHCVLGSS